MKKILFAKARGKNFLITSVIIEAMKKVCIACSRFNSNFNFPGFPSWVHAAQKIGNKIFLFAVKLFSFMNFFFVILPFKREVKCIATIVFILNEILKYKNIFFSSILKAATTLELIQGSSLS